MEINYQFKNGNEYAKVPGTSYRDNGKVRKKGAFTKVGLLIKDIIFSVIGKEESSLMILIPECSARQMKLIFPI
ncbi:MAG: hypothetical protein SOW34_16685 [Oliverpabstia sp.]|nr:hypothetical protein [Oliverpabstia sp.]